ncbi:MAG: hypothetical protein E8D41_16350 [Nitrospira sp.]|nr:MAG: hypothetical protein E8D41_16350 [Nitrospira sp.]
MLCRFIIAVFFIIISLAGPQDGPVGTLLAMEQPMADQPGLTPYTPTKIEWLALTVNSQLQYEHHATDPYELFVVQADHDTLQIFIQYLPAVYPRARAGDPRPFPTGDPGTMKQKIKAAREKIMATAKRYGWDTWVKIQEPVESSAPVQKK